MIEKNDRATRRFLSPPAEATYLALLSVGPDGEMLTDADRHELQDKALVMERLGSRAGRFPAAPPSAAFIFVFGRMRAGLMRLRERISNIYELEDRLHTVHVVNRILGNCGSMVDLMGPGQVGPVLKGFYETAQKHVGTWNTGPYATLERDPSLADNVLVPEYEAITE